MFQDPHLAVEFDYFGSDVELYQYLQKVADRITETDIVE